LITHKTKHSHFRETIKYFENQADITLQVVKTHNIAQDEKCLCNETHLQCCKHDDAPKHTEIWQSKVNKLNELLSPTKQKTAWFMWKGTIKYFDLKSTGHW